MRIRCSDLIVFAVMFILVAICPSFQDSRASSTSKGSPLRQNWTNSVGIEFVLIPAGTFMMGTPETEKDREPHEGPQHEVTIAKPFYMGKFEVTQTQWVAVMGNNPSQFKGDNLPVDNVCWNDAQEFISRLNALKDGYTYRLPSEAEWEYACRAGTTTPFGLTDAITADIVNYNGTFPYSNAPKSINREKTAPVGGLGKANAWGLYDMHGNVSEWCQDWFHDNYNGAPTDGSAWEANPSIKCRVFRGGSFNSSGNNCRSGSRDRYVPVGKFPDNGLRVVAVIK